MPAREASLLSVIHEYHGASFDKAASRNRAMIFIKFRLMNSAGGHANMGR